VRQYQYPATDDTVEALRLLRGAWASYRVEPRAFTVHLADGREVRVTVDRADVEPDFEAYRLRAEVTAGGGGARAAGDGADAPAAVRPAPDFAAGRNDLVLLTGATWVEGAAPGVGASLPPGAVVQFSGSPRQLSPGAAAVCLSTDAFVVASAAGTGVLVRTGVRPQTLAVTDDSAAVARFLGERGYGAEPASG
jgi:hypothetical protein